MASINQNACTGTEVKHGIWDKQFLVNKVPEDVVMALTLLKEEEEICVIRGR